MTKVSKYVTLREVTFSDTAVRKGIDNIPSTDQLELIKVAAEKVFDPLREWVNGPVKINSVFRGDKLNKAIGGSKTSQHCVGLDPKLNSYGAAFDVDDNFYHSSITDKDNNDMFHFIKDHLDFDQLIWEFGNKHNPNWVHFSYRPDKNRKQVLIAVKQSGKTVYLPYKGNEHLIEKK